MPTSLPERSQADRPSSLREIAAICIGCGAVLVLFAGLAAYDARVITWVSKAAQAEFSGSIEPDPQPVQLAVQKAVIK
jgi:hypothetical protein